MNNAINPMRSTISKKFIEANHGGIEVVSEEGKGSRFIIKLPLHEKE